MTETTATTDHVFPARLGQADVAALREKHYNASITAIRAHHPDLWVMHVEPDEAPGPFVPGQYTTLGLGYWEPRVDDASEDFTARPELLEKVARRSYSVSSSIVDGEGGLLPPLSEGIEFYIVLVAPTPGRIPALTPRLFSRQAEDRIYLGRKFTGRYTLEGVQPTDSVVFLATGTGEAPHNQMSAELLRRQHPGKILQVVCVRHRRDLAYIRQQETAQLHHPNYRYHPLTTRETGDAGNKVYIQDFIESGALESELGSPLDPSTTHVYLCGNPQMIGLPDWDEEGVMDFPEQRGVSEILHERGFSLDHRRQRGNVHYEEYWKS